VRTRRRWAEVVRRLSAAGIVALAVPTWGQAALGQSAPSTEALPAAGAIAFVTPDGRPALVDPRAGSVTRLSDEPQRAQFPAWSPDGTRAAFITSSRGSARVDVYDVAGGSDPIGVYRSAQEPPIYLAWSPTGDRIALLASVGGTLALRLVDAEGGGVRELTRGDPFYWDWSGDGQRLLVHRDVLRPGALVGFTGLDAFDVAEPLPDPGWFQAPAMSPSERFVAYATLRPGDVRRVVVMTAPGVDADPVVRRELPHRGRAAMAWHPARDLLAVQRPARETARSFGSLLLLDADTGDLEELVTATSLAFWWSPDGGAIAYVTLAAAPPQELEHRVSLGTQLVQGGPLPRLALWVIELDTMRSRPLTSFTPSTLFVNQYLPFFDQYLRSHRVWSPDGRALVFSALDARGVPQVTVFGLDGSVTPLAAGDMPAWNVR
jgi:TolB protein